MKRLQIEKTKYTVKVDFNPETGELEIEGASYPENASDFYQPIFDWIREYAAAGAKEVVLNLRLNYLNTSSTKCMLDIIDILEEYHRAGGAVNVNWYYAEDDEDILETGQEFAEDTEVPIILIPFKSEN